MLHLLLSDIIPGRMTALRSVSYSDVVKATADSFDGYFISPTTDVLRFVFTSTTATGLKDAVPPAAALTVHSVPVEFVRGDSSNLEWSTAGQQYTQTLGFGMS